MAKQNNVVAPVIVAQPNAYTVTDATMLHRTGLGTARTGSCVHAALVAIGDGCTVAEYRDRMAKWVATAKAGNAFAAYPSGGNADTVLRHLVTRVGKVRTSEGKPAKVAKATKAPAKPAKVAKATKAPANVAA